MFADVGAATKGAPAVIVVAATAAVFVDDRARTTLPRCAKVAVADDDIIYLVSYLLLRGDETLFEFRPSSKLFLRGAQASFTQSTSLALSTTQAAAATPAAVTGSWAPRRKLALCDVVVPPPD